MLKMLKFVFTQNNLGLCIGFYSICALFIIGGYFTQEYLATIWGSFMVFVFWGMNFGMWYKDNKATK